MNGDRVAAARVGGVVGIGRSVGVPAHPAGAAWNAAAAHGIALTMRTACAPVFESLPSAAESCSGMGCPGGGPTQSRYASEGDQFGVPPVSAPAGIKVLTR